MACPLSLSLPPYHMSNLRNNTVACTYLFYFLSPSLSVNRLTISEKSEVAVSNLTPRHVDPNQADFFSHFPKEIQYSIICNKTHCVYKVINLGTTIHLVDIKLCDFVRDVMENHIEIICMCDAKYVGSKGDREVVT